MQDIASNLSQLAFDELDAPPVVVGSRNLDHSVCRGRIRLFPPAILAFGRDSSENHAIEWSCDEYQPNHGRIASTPPPRSVILLNLNLKKFIYELFRKILGSSGYLLLVSVIIWHLSSMLPDTEVIWLGNWMTKLF